jgi:hypothetical protein
MKRVGDMRLNELGNDWIWVRETDASTAHALSRISDRFWVMCGYSWADGYQISRDLHPEEKCEICVRMVVLHQFCS